MEFVEDRMAVAAKRGKEPVAVPTLLTPIVDQAGSQGCHCRLQATFRVYKVRESAAVSLFRNWLRILLRFQKGEWESQSQLLMATMTSWKVVGGD